MKHKNKNRLIFAETVDVLTAMERILSILNFTIEMYEVEAIDTFIAHEEANKLVFAKPFYALANNTIAQWISKGGSEKKALEVIKDFIEDAVKATHKIEEQKLIMAKVFSK